MAWVKEYDMVWTGLKESGTIEIQRDGGSYIGPLLLKRDSLQVRQAMTDWESPILKANCSFTIINNSPDVSSWQEFLPLMTISQGQYRVVVTLDGGVSTNLFIGYLNCETINQDMNFFSELRLTASGLLDKLQYIEPVGITDPSRGESLINVIDYCLRETGAEYDIRVMCSLKYRGDGAWASGATAFNMTGVNTEIFWQDNVQRYSALEILKMILIPFNCYLYWYQDYWYIDYYNDLGIQGRTYVQYTSGVSYNIDTHGTAGVLGVQRWDVYSDIFEQVNGSQTLSISPGMKEIEIKLDQMQFFNLLNGDLSGLTEGTNPDSVYFREWYGDSTYVDHYGGTPHPLPGYNEIYGVPYKTIANSVKRDWLGVGYTGTPSAWKYGTSTRYHMTIVPEAEATITWKHGALSPPPGDPFGENPLGSTFFLKSEQCYVRFYFSVWINDPTTGIKTYLAYDQYGEVKWETSSTQPNNYHEISGAEYAPDKTRWVYDVSISIPIGDDTLGLAAEDDAEGNVVLKDLDVSFVCGAVTVSSDELTDYPNPEEAAFGYEVVGDFTASVSNTTEANLITGDTVSNFLDKKTINVRLFDTDNWNYRNTLLRGKFGIIYYIDKTKYWTEDRRDDTNLMDKLLTTKFRLYRVARQQIAMSLRIVTDNDTYVPRPGEIWVDDKQGDMEFVLADSVYVPDQDTYKVVLFEYDDTEEINLIE